MIKKIIKTALFATILTIVFSFSLVSPSNTFAAPPPPSDPFTISLNNTSPVTKPDYTEDQTEKKFGITGKVTGDPLPNNVHFQVTVMNSVNNPDWITPLDIKRFSDATIDSKGNFSATGFYVGSGSIEMRAYITVGDQRIYSNTIEVELECGSYCLHK